MELFDIVDRADNIIGTTDKMTAHSNGDLHRVAAVFVFSQTGELYVQQHPSDDKWDHSVGGHVSQGEPYADAAAREAEEELGIKQPLTELATSIYADEHPNMQHMFGLYSCIANPEWKFTPNPNDKVEVIFPMSIMAIRDTMRSDPEKFTAGFRTTMAEYIRLKDI